MNRVLSVSSVLFAFVFAVSLAGQAPAKIVSDADYMAAMKEIRRSERPADQSHQSR